MGPLPVAERQAWIGVRAQLHALEISNSYLRPVVTLGTGGKRGPGTAVENPARDRRDTRCCTFYLLSYFGPPHFCMTAVRPRSLYLQNHYKTAVPAAASGPICSRFVYPRLWLLLIVKCHKSYLKQLTLAFYDSLNHESNVRSGQPLSPCSLH